MITEREKAIDALEVGNYSQFQHHSRELLMLAKNGYMCGFLFVIFPIILYLVFIVGMIVSTILG